jgi:hypothetical protein
MGWRKMAHLLRRLLRLGAWPPDWNPAHHENHDLKTNRAARPPSIRAALARGVAGLLIAMAAFTLASAPVFAKTGSAKSSSTHVAKSANSSRAVKAPKSPGARAGSHSAKPRAAHPAPSARSPHASRTPGTPGIKGHGGRSKAVPGVSRDKDGHIARSAQARNDFKRSHPCPSTGKSSGTCPGYVIDHVKPLKRGGADSPGNMQWQTTQAAKQKDKVE